ncbi:MAG: DUF1292 domain-containing protein [Oscillospiraceae bacterium]|nr:DUF1292 domain-containing protein [Oscillospiraceae bacterium]
MSEEYGSNFITLTDEDGNEFELEHLDTIEYNGKVYMAFFPLVETEDGETTDEAAEEDYGLIILRVDEVDGEELLSVIEDEDELDAAYNEFMESLFEDEEE